MANSFWQRWLPRAVFLVVFLSTLAIGLMGLNYGTYGDETKLLASVSDSTRTLLFLPRWYNYPSLSYEITLLNMTPDLVKAGVDALHTHLFSHALLDALSQKPLSDLSFLLRTRGLFFIVTWLGVLWTYLLTRLLIKKEWVASLSASFLASSWELQYHARLIAPDGLVFSFGALCLFLVALFLENRKRVYLLGATIAAGLACGAKYPGGIFLLPVLIAAVTEPSDAASPPIERRPFLTRLKPLASLFGLFCLVFLLTTPGALAEPFKFISGILFEIHHYQTEHALFTVAPGIPHQKLLFDYFATVVLSRNLWIALVGFVVAVPGYGWFIKTQTRHRSFIFCLFPILFFAFMTQQKVMTVRNHLLLFSSLSLFFGYGILFLFSRLKQPITHLLLLSCVGAAVIFNLVQQLQALRTIRHPELTRTEAISVLVEVHEPVYLSPLAQRFFADAPEIQPFLTKNPTEAASYVFLDQEVTNAFPANHARTYQVLGGSLESNMDYYTTFLPGPTKIVRMDAAQALRSGLIRVPAQP